MRVVITADPYYPVPPLGYGGIERVVDVLVRGLCARGHEVTVVAHPESSVPTRLIPYGVPPHWGLWPRFAELVQVGSALLRLARSADVVHSFGRLAALAPVLPWRNLAKIQSYQRAIPWRGVERASRLAGDSLHFTACSTSLHARAGTASTRWSTVYNPVDVGRYAATPTVSDDAPLVFLGRIEQIKGTHAAIAIARAAGRRLVIAGNRADELYFDREVAPHVDGRDVAYVGEIGDAGKNALLGSAAALLMPIEWEEPFGIVMIEALACGTPVIGYARGAVPEVIRDGVTGFVVADAAQATEAVRRLPLIDRAACRADAVARFGADEIVDQYLRVYAAVQAVCA